MKTSTQRFLLATALVMIAASMASAADERFHLSGTVTHRGGTPASSVWILVEQQNDVVGKFLTGDDGKYFVRGLEGGTYTLSVKRKGETLFHATVVVKSNRVFDVKID